MLNDSNSRTCPGDPTRISKSRKVSNLASLNYKLVRIRHAEIVNAEQCRVPIKSVYNLKNITSEMTRNRNMGYFMLISIRVGLNSNPLTNSS